MSNSVFMTAILLRAFNFQSPLQKKTNEDKTHAVGDENEGE